MTNANAMSKTILMVEDNAIHAALIMDVLEYEGFDTVWAKDSNEAMNSVRDHRPDLVIMDIQLPGISGIEVTKAIKADCDLKDIPVIAVTAFASKEDEAIISDAGCSEILTKPFSWDGLVEIIAKYLGEPA